MSCCSKCGGPHVAAGTRTMNACIKYLLGQLAEARRPGCPRCPHCIAHDTNVLDADDPALTTNQPQGPSHREIKSALADLIRQGLVRKERGKYHLTDAGKKSAAKLGRARRAKKISRAEREAIAAEVQDNDTCPDCHGAGCFQGTDDNMSIDRCEACCGTGKKL